MEMSTVEMKETIIESHGNKEPFQKKNKVVYRTRQKTKYDVSPDKMNLTEIRRLINHKNLKFDNNRKHLKELYDIERVKRKMREELKKNNETKKLKESLSKCTFNPLIDQKSKTLMHKKEDQVERCYLWLNKKKMNLKIMTEDQKQKELAREKLQLQPLQKYPNKITAVSKVKTLLENPNLNNNTISQNHNTIKKTKINPHIKNKTIITKKNQNHSENLKIKEKDPKSKTLKNNDLVPTLKKKESETKPKNLKNDHLEYTNKVNKKSNFALNDNEKEAIDEVMELVEANYVAYIEENLENSEVNKLVSEKIILEKSEVNEKNVLENSEVNKLVSEKIILENSEYNELISKKIILENYEGNRKSGAIEYNNEKNVDIESEKEKSENLIETMKENNMEVSEKEMEISEVEKMAENHNISFDN